MNNRPRKVSTDDDVETKAMGAEASSPKKEPRDAAPAKPYRLATAIAGVFALYVAHDALQERAFRTKGFTFGWFMTLVEIVVVSVCAAALEWGTPPDENMAADDLKTARHPERPKRRRPSSMIFTGGR